MKTILSTLTVCSLFLSSAFAELIELPEMPAVVERSAGDVIKYIVEYEGKKIELKGKKVSDFFAALGRDEATIDFAGDAQGLESDYVIVQVTEIALSDSRPMVSNHGR